MFSSLPSHFHLRQFNPPKNLIFTNIALKRNYGDHVIIRHTYCWIYYPGFHIFTLQDTTEQISNDIS